jgi:hypothetical protein
VAIYLVAALAYGDCVEPERKTQMELYLLGAAHGVTERAAEALTDMPGTYIIRKDATGLFNVYRLRDMPLYSGQVPFMVRRTDTLEVVQ